jgi:pyruvate/2-oxoglutarate dehydrogenase complex dihydrolipoamide dehydrogenase (E3) component
MGGGPIGVELAQAHRRLGAEVSIVEAGRLLPREDAELASVIERRLAAEGIDIRVGAAVAAVEPRGDRIAVLLEGGDAIEGSHLLVATGRTPTVDGLGLKAAGIKADRSGILVNRALRTSNRRVYAIGDCAGGAGAAYRWTHSANHQAGLVIRSALFRLPIGLDADSMPRVTFTDPELAAVGMSEDDARAARRPFRILRWPFAENDRAQAERATEGLVKAIVAPRGRVLGCAIAGPHAGELIAPWTLAIRKGLKAQDLAGTVFPYPTLSEASKRAAVEFLRPSAESPWVRRLIRILRLFG